MFRKCALIAFFLRTATLFSVTDTWTGTMNGMWGVNANWQSMMIPGGAIGDIANLTSPTAINTTITLDAMRILGQLNLALPGYTLNPGGGGSFQFQTNAGGATITVNSGANTIAAPISLLSPLQITQSSSNSLIISGTITGTQTLLLQGTGTLQLTANNAATYSGLITIDSGTISIVSDDRLGQALVALTINNGTLLYTGNDSNSRPMTLTGGAGIQTSTGVTAALMGVLSGAGSLTTSGPDSTAIVVLSGANTYQGGTTISGGTLSISSDGNLGDTAGSLNILNGRLLITATLPSTARSGTFSGNAVIDSGTTNTFSGNFSGSGNLTVTGGGTSVFVGSNSYTGGTLVAASTHLAGTTNGLQGNITLNAATSLVTFSQNFDGTYSGALTGPVGSQLTKVGLGTVTFTGASPFMGTTAITEDALIVNGSLASSPVTVTAGGILGGSGTVGPTTNSGLIDPGVGTTVGTLNINGALLYAGGSTNINIAPLAADRIAVNNTATISGPLQIEPIPAFYGFSADYTILTSTGLAGTFDPVTSTNPAFTPSVTYSGTSAFLHIAISEPFAVFPFSNVNTAAVGNNIDALHAANQFSTDLFNIFNSFVGQSNEVINAALDQMHPAPYSGFTEMQTEVNGQLISLFHRLPYLPCSCNKAKRLWIEGFGNSLTMKNHGIQIGFQGNSGGIAFGYDGQINDSLVVGLGGAWSNNTLTWREHRGHGEVNGLYGGVYFDAQVGSFYFGGSCLAGMDFFETTRHMEFVTTNRHATADFSAFDLTAQIATAYLFGAPQAFFYPYANIDYIYLNTHKFSEKKADGLNLNVFARTDGTLRTEMGLGLQVQDQNVAETACISPLISIGWVNMCPVERPKLVATFQGATIPFKVIGWDESWNLFNVNFALSIAYRCYSVRLNYNVEFSPDSHTLLFNQHGNLRLDWKW